LDDVLLDFVGCRSYIFFRNEFSLEPDLLLLILFTVVKLIISFISFSILSYFYL